MVRIGGIDGDTDFVRSFSPTTTIELGGFKMELITNPIIIAATISVVGLITSVAFGFRQHDKSTKQRSLLSTRNSQIETYIDNLLPWVRQMIPKVEPNTLDKSSREFWKSITSDKGVRARTAMILLASDNHIKSLNNIRQHSLKDEVPLELAEKDRIMLGLFASMILSARSDLREDTKLSQRDILEMFVSDNFSNINDDLTAN